MLVVSHATYRRRHCMKLKRRAPYMDLLFIQDHPISRHSRSEAPHIHFMLMFSLMPCSTYVRRDCARNKPLPFCWSMALQIQRSGSLAECSCDARTEWIYPRCARTMLASRRKDRTRCASLKASNGASQPCADLRRSQVGAVPGELKRAGFDLLPRGCSTSPISRGG